MLKTVQAGRGLAAIGVAAYHLTLALQDPKYFGWPVMGKVTWHLDLGVDFFFVLSGLIIINAHNGDIGRPEMVGSFISKRFSRLYPAYWLYLLAYCLWEFAISRDRSHEMPSFLEWVSAISLVRLDGFVPPLIPAWTLFHEVSFYALVALSIWSRRLGFAVAIIVLIATLALFQYPSELDRPPVLDYLSGYNLHFLIGIAAFYLSREPRPASALPAIFVGSLVIGLCLWSEAHGSVFVAFPLLYAMGFGAILTGAVSWERARKVPLRLPLLTLLGDASYSIYLTHPLIEHGFAKVFFRFGGVIGPYGVFAADLIATIAAGCAAYLLLERPLLAMLRKRLARRGEGVMTAGVPAS
jgi:peptidoglycan/LPS O-acetylase OafA/YrhL